MFDIKHLSRVRFNFKTYSTSLLSERASTKIASFFLVFFSEFHLSDWYARAIYLSLDALFFVAQRASFSTSITHNKFCYITSSRRKRKVSKRFQTPNSEVLTCYLRGFPGYSKNFTVTVSSRLVDRQENAVYRTFRITFMHDKITINILRRKLFEI